MKKCLFVLFLAFVSFSALSQKDTVITTDDYFTYYSLKSTAYNYVYLYQTQGGKKVNYYCYFEHQGKYKLAVFEKDTFKFEKVYKSDVLFKEVELNTYALTDIKRKSEKDIKEFHKKFSDSTLIFQQIGIRYKGLHNNHYQPKSENEIAKLKGKNEVHLARLINSIYKWFEENGKLANPEIK